MNDYSRVSFAFPDAGHKKVTTAFDGGCMTSNGGVRLLAAAKAKLGLAERLAAKIADPRDPDQIVHEVSFILKACILAIVCGYEDGNDLNALRSDPAFKLACSKLPERASIFVPSPPCRDGRMRPPSKSWHGLWASWRDLCCESYKTPPEAVTLDMDDTIDVVHGHQQLSLFNAHEDERCFKPIHVYDTATGRPVMMVLRPGKTPSGKEVRGHMRRLIRRIRTHWPAGGTVPSSC